jgi:serine/threonine-protein kinase RsbW
LKVAKDVVRLRTPLLEDYEMIVRLTASGIASQMGYTYEQIEDIKVAISNVLTEGYKISEGEYWTINFDFIINENNLSMEIDLVNEQEELIQQTHIDRDDVMDLSYAKAIMNELIIFKGAKHLRIKMTIALFENKGGQDGRKVNTLL